ncbi:MAG: hypothetical protein EBU84_11445 [Actinobacteria bacterium]|nr:hypothetical protein [Actinomycetota bacterium]
MTAIANKRKRWTRFAIALGVVGAIAVPTSLAVGSYALLNAKGGNEIDTSDVMTIPATPGALLAITDSDGNLASANVLALAPGGVGGTVISVPVGALADVGEGEEPRRIGDVFAAKGLKGFKSEIEGLLDVTFSVAAAMDPEKLASLLEPFAPGNVSLNRPVTETVLGNESVVVPAGESEVNAEQLALLLSAVRADQPEQVRFERSIAMWTAVATAVGDGMEPDEELEPLDADGAPTSFKGFFNRMVAGPLQVYQFEATFIGEPLRNPKALDLYELDPTFEISTPFVDPQVVKNAVAVITFWGGSVLLVREIPGPAKVATSVLYSDSIIKRDINGFSPVLGPLSLKLSEEDRVRGIDVRITLGQNFVDFTNDPTKFGEKIGGTTTTTTTTPG